MKKAATDIGWVEVRDSAKHATIVGQPPTTIIEPKMSVVPRPRKLNLI